MKPMLAMFAAFAFIILGAEILRVHLVEQSKVKSAERYAAYKVAEDARLSKACDEGRTGIVLYYKGKHCGQ
jgi:hypothetical protein